MPQWLKKIRVAELQPFFHMFICSGKVFLKFSVSTYSPPVDHPCCNLPMSYVCSSHLIVKPPAVSYSLIIPLQSIYSLLFPFCPSTSLHLHTEPFLIPKQGVQIKAYWAVNRQECQPPPHLPVCQFLTRRWLASKLARSLEHTALGVYLSFQDNVMNTLMHQQQRNL